MDVADPPRITTHPQGMRDAVPGEPVMLTAEAELHSVGKDPTINVSMLQ